MGADMMDDLMKRRHDAIKLDVLQSEIGRLREVVRVFADELEIYIGLEYQYRDDYPHIMAKYNRDIEPIIEARSLIAESTPPAPKEVKP